MKELGNASEILGMTISRNAKSSTLCVSQRPYLEKDMKGFPMLGAKIVQIILGAHFYLSLHDYPSIIEEIDYMPKVQYFRVVASIMFDMV